MARVPVLYAVREIADALDERLTPLVADAGLTLPQFNVLYLVVEEGPMRLGQLAQHRRCVKSNVSHLVRTMEAQGLLSLIEDPDDRRARVVQASDEGLACYRTVRRQAAYLERQLRQALGDDGRDELVRLCLAAAHALDNP